ncbi:KaiC/GvpD/RAD55 family RecA-like ATPase [Haloferula luteola]|uniref:KaiC/GvpD/RAD55 family RecA-like ATPase n=1 Tax=Haloferula luteola TaxID=595692 RepID=A0A840V878_9BACT|nr:RAD55 family ATPase [Haloferula luteola]MBB5353923.1 KaiC/GvpD/RAD55 family RecA-like ATPase [Haloferula luteola]
MNTTDPTGSLTSEVSGVLSVISLQLRGAVAKDLELIAASVEETLEFAKAAAEEGHDVDLVRAVERRKRPNWLDRHRFEMICRFHSYCIWSGDEDIGSLFSLQIDNAVRRKVFCEALSSRIRSCEFLEIKERYCKQCIENGVEDSPASNDEIVACAKVESRVQTDVYDSRSNLRDLLESICSHGLSEQHARYLMFRVIRAALNMRLSFSYIARFQRQVSIVNEISSYRRLFVDQDKSYPYDKDAIRPKVSLATIASRSFEVTKFEGKESKGNLDDWDELVAVLAVGSLIGHIRLRGDFVRVTPPVLDAEYLISLAFGHSTGIRRFDDLFGGGGLMLADQISSGPKYPDALPGRVILVRGENGCGKTMLALSLAAEIASKGGFCVFNALEYSSQVAQYVLARCGFGPSDSPFDVVCRSSDFLRVCKRPSGGRGLLFIRDLEPSNEMPLNYSTLFKEIETDILPRSDRGAPVIVFVDSLNALTRMSDPLEKCIPLEVERRAVLAALQRITAMGGNVLVTAEEDATWSGFGEDIADTVIRLSSGGNEGCQGRDFVKRSHRGKYISVWKSRLQRELAGNHPFRIRSGKGFEVYLATSSFAEIDKGRGPAFAYLGLFGVVDLDMVLSGLEETDDHGRARGVEEVIYNADPKFDCGSVILLKGGLGTYKTQLGLGFVSWFSYDGYLLRKGDGSQGWELLPPKAIRELAKRVGLVISIRYSSGDIDVKLRQAICKETIGHMRRSSVLRGAAPRKIIWTCKLEAGYVYPGEVFDQIESFFARARREGLMIDRVFLDNPGEWEDFCPLLGDDEIFGNTLITFLRRRRVKIVVSNRMIRERESGVIRAVSEAVDTWVDLSHDTTEVMGGDNMTLQVRRSPGMDHYRHKVRLLHASGEGVRLHSENCE